MVQRERIGQKYDKISERRKWNMNEEKETERKYEIKK
jgi:hypothetical protein